MTTATVFTVSNDRSAIELRDTVRGWLVFFVLATAGTVLIICANPVRGWSATITAAAIVVAGQLAYLLIARPSLAGLRTDGARARIFAVIAVVGFGPAVFLNPWSLASLFALTTQLFLLLTFRWAAGVITVLNAAGLSAEMIGGPHTLRFAVQQTGIAVFIITFSLFFGSRMVAIASRSDERLQLIGRLRDREAEVAALSAARGAEAERARIARDMHDTLAQGFTSILTLSRAVLAELDTDPAAARRHVEFITTTAGENLTESRRIIRALTPARLEGASLADAIGRTVTAFAAETGIRAQLRIEGNPMAAIPSAEVVALRVVQESLANIRKHAHAGTVEVVLSYVEDAITITVHDDGVGFDMASSTAGFGLAGMRDRTAEAGGTLRVQSAPGDGTRIVARIPAVAS